MHRRIPYSHEIHRIRCQVVGNLEINGTTVKINEEKGCDVLLGHPVRLESMRAGPGTHFWVPAEEESESLFGVRLGDLREVPSDGEARTRRVLRSTVACPQSLLRECQCDPRICQDILSRCIQVWKIGVHNAGGVIESKSIAHGHDIPKRLTHESAPRAQNTTSGRCDTVVTVVHQPPSDLCFLGPHRSLSRRRHWHSFHNHEKDENDFLQCRSHRFANNEKTPRENRESSNG